MSKVKFTLALFVLLLSLHFSMLLVASGFFHETLNLGLEKCHSITGIHGPEDFAQIRSSGLVFISSDERLNGNILSPHNGSIVLFDPLTHQRQILTSDVSFEFHPHGIDLWESSSETILYVINHRSDFSSVEVFNWDGAKLKHKKTIQNELLINPNDIVTMGKDQFYLSHDHGSKNILLKKIETYSRMGRGYVTLYQEGNFRIMAKSIAYANGMATSLDRGILYVASMLGQKIEVFNIAKDNSLIYLKSIKLEVSPDNIVLDRDGSLLISAHSKLFDLQSHMKDHAKSSPFEILRISHPDQKAVSSRIIAGDGKGISGVSMAFPVGDKFLLGTIFMDKFLICPKP